MKRRAANAFKPNDLASRLAAVELLCDLPEAARSALVRGRRALRLRRGSVVFRLNDPPALYVVLDGRVTLFRPLGPGDEIALLDRHAGEVFGEPSLLLGRQICEARAPKSALVLRLDARAVQAALHDCAPAMATMAKSLAERLAIFEARLEEIAVHSVKARLHSLLSRLAREGGVANSRGYLLRNQLAHEELARMVGASRVAVTRALQQLERDGTILRTGRRIIVHREPPTFAGGD